MDDGRGEIVGCEMCDALYDNKLQEADCPHRWIDPATYSNIREILGDFVGKKLLDITQHDIEEYQDGNESFVMLMFEDGSWIKFPIGDPGFVFNETGEDDDTMDIE